MKIRVDTAVLNAALRVVGIVPPSLITATCGAGYLFVIKDGKCSIHSRDQTRRARVEVPVIEAEGDGMFVYPTSIVAGLKFLDGWIDIEFGCDEDRHWLKYKTEGGANASASTFDPRLMQAIDSDIAAAESSFTVPAVILKDAIASVNTYVAKANNNRVGDVFKTLQAFDSSLEGGNGTLYGADNIRACYFYCDALQDKKFSLHTEHTGLITAFLSKCEGDVSLKLSEGVSFIVAADGSAVGWSSAVEEHKKFKYYGYGNDTYVLTVPKDSLVKAFRHVSSETVADKIRIEYDHETKALQFKASGAAGSTLSAPVVMTPVTGEDGDTSFGGASNLTHSFGANISTKHLQDLIEPTRGNEILLRVAVMPATKARREMVLFRTIEQFYLDGKGKVVIPDDETKEEAHLCRVTRFAPSRD